MFESFDKAAPPRRFPGITRMTDPHSSQLKGKPVEEGRYRGTRVKGKHCKDARSRRARCGFRQTLEDEFREPRLPSPGQSRRQSPIVSQTRLAAGATSRCRGPHARSPSGPGPKAARARRMARPGGAAGPGECLRVGLRAIRHEQHRTRRRALLVEGHPDRLAPIRVGRNWQGGAGCLAGLRKTSRRSPAHQRSHLLMLWLATIGHPWCLGKSYRVHRTVLFLAGRAPPTRTQVFRVLAVYGDEKTWVSSHALRQPE